MMLIEENCNTAHIAVCVCTRERPHMLDRIMRSYADLLFPKDVKVTLVIIENDLKANCRDQVMQLAKDLELSVSYYCETRLGIPFARNRALDAAQSINASHIAFADDDEWFQPEWLLAFWRCREVFGKEVILQGPVISVLPPGVPEYYSEFYYTGSYTTGTILSKCATNNVLIPLEAVSRHQLRFDESRPFSGGEDTVFFNKANDLGIVMRACEEAYIYEEVMIARTRMSWLIRRNFRIGATWGNYQTEEMKRNSFIASGSQVPKLIIRFTYSALFLIALNKKNMKKWFLKFVRTSGRIIGCFGFQLEVYREVDS